MDESDILPCPFCGKPPFVEPTGFHGGGRTIRCEADDCMGPHTTAACVDDAVFQWNKRDPSMLDTLRLSRDWMDKHDQLLGFIQARPALLKELIAERALGQSASATEKS